MCSSQLRGQLEAYEEGSVDRNNIHQQYQLCPLTSLSPGSRWHIPNKKHEMHAHLSSPALTMEQMSKTVPKPRIPQPRTRILMQDIIHASSLGIAAMMFETVHPTDHQFPPFCVILPWLLV